MSTDERPKRRFLRSRSGASARFVFTFSVVPLASLAILVTSFLTLVAERKIKAAARHLKTTSPYEIAKETGMDLDDLVLILDRLMPAGIIADEEGGMPPKTE